jgi:polysaccharide biosynthesis protein PslG
MVALGASTTQDLDTMRTAGVGIVRVALYQQQIETSPGRFNWSGADQVVGNYASRGIGTLPVLLSSPPPLGSASAGQDWQQFVHEFVARYKPGGSYWTDPSLYGSQHPGASPLPIEAYQVFNEPNLPKYFPSSAPVSDYAKLLALASDAIHGVDPSAKVVLAGMPTLQSKFVAFPGWKFLDQLYQVPGAKDDFDVAAAHPYAESIDQLREAIKRIRRVMSRHGDKLTPVWLTEFGYGSAPFNHHLNFGIQGQAKMMSKSFNLLLRMRESWHVGGVLWYDWRDPPQGNPDCSFCSSAGVLNPDYSPKPSFLAWERFTGGGP